MRTMKAGLCVLAALALLAAGCGRETEEALKQKAGDLEKATRDLAALKADMAGTKQEAAKAAADLATARAEITAARGEIDAGKAELEKQVAAMVTLKADAEKAKAEIEAITTAKTEVEKARDEMTAELEKCKAAAAQAPSPEEAVRTALAARVAASYAAVERGDIDAWGADLAADAFFIGSAAFEAISGKDAILANLRTIFGPAIQGGGTFTVKSTNLLIGVAPDARSAWVSDELDFVLTLGENRIPMPFRVTTLYVEKDGAWMVQALAWSLPVPNEDAMTKAAGGQWQERAAIADLVDPGAEPVAAAFTGVANDVGAFLATVTDREDAFCFGTAAEEKIPTGAAIKQAFGQMIQQAGVTTARNGGVRAGISASGTVGWVASNLDFSVAAEGGQITVPYRFLGVYLNEAGAWRLVQVHFSIGLSEAK
ncbi:MAG: nuclear transport factor 2 family protein [Deltaproteobacteria bacterium]|nr:nuclear transport factor 2 family protein [Deltaproteobacteria bacterium]